MARKKIDWEAERGLRRKNTAILLIPGGILALGVVAFTYYANRTSMNQALSGGVRLEVAWAGIVAVIVAVISLFWLVDGFSVGLGILNQALAEDDDEDTVTDGNEQGGAVAVADNADVDDALRDVDSYPRVYYCVVALEVVGFWVLSASFGGYIHSPLGIVFTSIILFGQIRGNQRRDLMILFAVGIIGCATSDLICTNGWLSRVFPSASDVVIKPWSWYVAIPVTLIISTWVNWRTFKVRRL